MENCWFGLLLSEFEDRSHSKNHMFSNCFYYLRLKLCKQFIELSSTPSIFFLRRLGCMQSLIQLQLDLILLNSTWMCSPVPFCNPVEELVKIHDRDPWRTTSARLAVRSLRRWRTLQISMATLEYRLTQNPPPARRRIRWYPMCLQRHQNAASNNWGSCIDATTYSFKKHGAAINLNMLSLQLPNWWFQSDDSSILGPIPTFCQSLQCHLLQRPFTTGRQHGTEHDESTVVTSGSTIQEQLTAVEELMTRHLRQTERMVHGSYPGCSLKEPKQNPGWRLPPRVTSSNSGFIENQSWRLNQILKHSPGVLLDFCSFLTLLDLHLSRHARITWQFAAIRACQPSQLGLVTLNSSRTILATQTCHVTWYHLILLYFNMLRSRCHIEFHSIFPSNFRQNVYSLSTKIIKLGGWGKGPV